MQVIVLCTDYLLNALWQVPLVFALAWVIARGLRRLGPVIEHRVWVTALCVQTVLPAVSLGAWTAALRHLLTQPAGAHGAVTVTLGIAHPLGTGVGQVLRMELCVAAYGAIVAVFFFRFFWQWFGLRTLLQNAVPATLGAGDAAFLDACLQRLHLRGVRLITAPGVISPVTFGSRRPWLLLPPDFAERVSPQQLHAALAHELAHVSRRDYAKHVAYRFLVLPLVFHPVAWSTLSRVAGTREEICDSMAADLLGSRKQYAHSLLQLASLLVQLPRPHSYAIGIFDANRFERRITMLTETRLPISRLLRVSVLTASVALALGACTSAAALRLAVAPPAAGTTDGPKKAKVDASVMAGQLVTNVVPKYPEDAKKAKISGQVVLAAVIGKDGRVENLRIVSGPKELQTSALDAVHQWVYKPYLLNGQPTEVETTITVHYTFAE